MGGLAFELVDLLLEGVCLRVHPEHGVGWTLKLDQLEVLLAAKESSVSLGNVGVCTHKLLHQIV